MPTPAKKSPESGKKRGRPLPKSSSAEKKKASSSPNKQTKKSSSPSPTKRPRGRPPNAKVSSNAPSVSVFDPNLPPPPPPPPPVDNPFYQKFVKDYWQNNYFINMPPGAVITTVAGFGAPLPEELAAAAAHLDSDPSAAIKADADDEVESSSI